MGEKTLVLLAVGGIAIYMIYRYQTSYYKRLKKAIIVKGEKKIVSEPEIKEYIEKEKVAPENIVYVPEYPNAVAGVKFNDTHGLINEEYIKNITSHIGSENDFQTILKKNNLTEIID